MTGVMTVENVTVKVTSDMTATAGILLGHADSILNVANGAVAKLLLEKLVLVLKVLKVKLILITQH
jgi:hypothetical protein